MNATALSHPILKLSVLSVLSVATYEFPMRLTTWKLKYPGMK